MIQESNSKEEEEKRNVNCSACSSCFYLDIIEEEGHLRVWVLV